MTSYRSLFVDLPGLTADPDRDDDPPSPYGASSKDWRPFDTDFFSASQNDAPLCRLIDDDEIESKPIIPQRPELLISRAYEELPACPETGDWGHDNHHDHYQMDALSDTAAIPTPLAPGFSASGIPVVEWDCYQKKRNVDLCCHRRSDDAADRCQPPASSFARQTIQCDIGLFRVQATTEQGLMKTTAMTTVAPSLNFFFRTTKEKNDETISQQREEMEPSKAVPRKRPPDNHTKGVLTAPRVIQTTAPGTLANQQEGKKSSLAAGFPLFMRNSKLDSLLFLRGSTAQQSWLWRLQLEATTSPSLLGAKVWPMSFSWIIQAPLSWSPRSEGRFARIAIVLSLVLLGQRSSTLPLLASGQGTHHYVCTPGESCLPYYALVIACLFRMTTRRHP